VSSPSDFGFWLDRSRLEWGNPDAAPRGGTVAPPQVYQTFNNISQLLTVGKEKDSRVFQKPSRRGLEPGDGRLRMNFEELVE
jgi:hypothetical protein